MVKENRLLNMFARQMNHPVPGVFSICSAHPFVIQAAMLQAKIDGTPLLLEGTSNQVNQFGGYTGMTPAQYVLHLKRIAKQVDYPFDQVILGGDHLGPYVWRAEPAVSALEKSQELIKEFVLAGFTKIHLDTSIRCQDDRGDKQSLADPKLIAERTAQLCRVAEWAYGQRADSAQAPLYVIGTEVPLPGGAQDALNGAHVTPVEQVQETFETTKGAFEAKGLESAWDRIVAVVVQPGVEFDHDSVIDYDREKARSLSRFIREWDPLIYEVHSTDYQTRTSLRNLIRDRFAILKVGPWLTFVFREAMLALEAIEVELLTNRKGITLSRLFECVDEEMEANPVHWQDYYLANEPASRYLRKYSFSDRVRYYWHLPRLKDRVKRLIDNLTKNPIPQALLSQHMPAQYRAVREGVLENRPMELIHHKIMGVMKCYSEACQFGEA